MCRGLGFVRCATYSQFNCWQVLYQWQWYTVLSTKPGTTHVSLEASLPWLLEPGRSRHAQESRGQLRKLTSCMSGSHRSTACWRQRGISTPPYSSLLCHLLNMGTPSAPELQFWVFPQSLCSPWDEEDKVSGLTGSFQFPRRDSNGHRVALVVAVNWGICYGREILSGILLEPELWQVGSL